MSECVFERYEYKYRLSKKQYEDLFTAIKPRLIENEYSHVTIQSLYYDTNDYRLIRASIEATNYKEKLRLRAYGIPKSDNDNIYLEIKKKNEGIVYKRRIPLRLKDSQNDDILKETQIGKEILYFKRFYQNIGPKYLLIYDREAYQTDDDVRITFDHNPRYRINDLDITHETTGKTLFANGDVILEIKALNAIPLWFTELLSKFKIYKSSFSKYGEAYKQELEKVR